MNTYLSSYLSSSKNGTTSAARAAASFGASLVAWVASSLKMMADVWIPLVASFGSSKAAPPEFLAHDENPGCNRLCSQSNMQFAEKLMEKDFNLFCKIRNLEWDINTSNDKQKHAEIAPGLHTSETLRAKYQETFSFTLCLYTLKRCHLTGIGIPL